MPLSAIPLCLFNKRGLKHLQNSHQKELILNMLHGEDNICLSLNYSHSTGLRCWQDGFWVPEPGLNAVAAWWRHTTVGSNPFRIMLFFVKPIWQSCQHLSPVLRDTADPLKQFSDGQIFHRAAYFRRALFDVNFVSVFNLLLLNKPCGIILFWFHGYLRAAFSFGKSPGASYLFNYLHLGLKKYSEFEFWI